MNVIILKIIIKENNRIKDPKHFFQCFLLDKYLITKNKKTMNYLLKKLKRKEYKNVALLCYMVQ